MKLTSLVAVLALASLAAGASLSAACSSNDSGGDNGGSASDYCSALSSYVSKCNITNTCTVASAKTCTQYVSAFSPAALAAFTSCTSNLACGDAGTATTATCIAAQEASITLSATQQKLAQDYCAVCASAYGQTTSDCAQGFYALLTTANTDGAASGTSADIGSPFLELNDSIVTSVDTTCVSPIGADAGALGCVATFESCAGTVVNKAVTTPAACASETPGGTGAQWRPFAR